MIEPTTKVCLKKTCKRAGKELPLSDFTVNNLLEDGRAIYCRQCTQKADRDRRRRAKAAGKLSHPERLAKKAMAPVEPPPPSDAERVVAVLQDGKRLEFRALARAAQLSHEDLFTLLPRIVGDDKPLMSKNGTAPRVYFLNNSPKPTPRTMTYEEREKYPPLSFATISFLHPVIGGRMTVNDSQRESDLQEINRLAHELGYIKDDDRTVYENLLGTYFHDANSARELDQTERAEWLRMLKLWRQGAQISAATSAALGQRRTA